MREIIIDNPPSKAAIELASMIVQEYGLDRFARVLTERVPDAQGQLNGKQRIVAGSTLYLACEKLGGRFRHDLKVDVADQIRQELIHAVDNPRVISGRQLAFAVRVRDYARDRFTRRKQCAQGGDKKSAAAKAQKQARTAFPAQESLPYGPYQSDLGAKNDDSQESVEAAEIAAQLTQIGVLSIKAGVKFRKLYPEIFERMDRGDFETFGQAKFEATRISREKRSTSIAADVLVRRRTAQDNFELICRDNFQAVAKRDFPRVDFIFADPPYNNGWKYDSDTTGDKVADDTYLHNLRLRFEQWKQVLRDGGALCVLMPNEYAGRVEVMLRRHFFWKTTVTVWNHFPQNQTENYPQAAKQLLVFTKNKNHIWHPPRVESTRNAIGDARAASEGKVPDNVWPILKVAGNYGPKAPFRDSPPQQPTELPLRSILAMTEPGMTVLDPYCGNGTTGMASVISGRKFIGIDRSAKYIDQSRTMILQAIAEGPSPHLQAIIEDKIVPFAELSVCPICGTKRAEEGL